MIVIDTNVLAYLLLEEADPRLRSHAKKILQREDRVLLPSLWRHEFLNVLGGYAKHGNLSLAAAERCWYQAVATVQNCEAPVDMARALTLCVELGISAYDAQFLALAEGANTVLVTEDRRLRKAAAQRTRSLEEHLAA